MGIHTNVFGESGLEIARTAHGDVVCITVELVQWQERNYLHWAFNQNLWRFPAKVFRSVSFLAKLISNVLFLGTNVKC